MMHHAARSLLFVGLAACCSATPPPAAPARVADTGLLDEASFQRLHELTGEAAPPPRGTTIDLAGSRAYLSLPAGVSAPMPGIVVIHEWWGLNDHIRHWADRLAEDGYATLAVDLYGGEVATDPARAMALMQTVDEARAKVILTAAHRFLREDPRIAAPKRGVVGWCFGGAWSLQQAILQPDLDAAVIYYGRPVTDEAQLTRIGARLLGVFANRDQSIPPTAVDGLVTALEHVGKTIELHRYDADHAFANPSGAHYDTTAAGDAWEHVRAFFRQTLR